MSATEYGTDLLGRTRQRAQGYRDRVCDHDSDELASILDELADEIERLQVIVNEQSPVPTQYTGDLK